MNALDYIYGYGLIALYDVLIWFGDLTGRYFYPKELWIPLLICGTILCAVFLVLDVWLTFRDEGCSLPRQ